MGAKDKALAAVAEVLASAKSGGKKIGRIAKGASKSGKAAYDLARSSVMPGFEEGVIPSLGKGIKAGAAEAASTFGGLGARGKRDVIGTGAAGGLGLMATLGLMSGGDEDAMRETAGLSGIPMGEPEDQVKVMRSAMIPKVKNRIMREIESGKKPDQILQRVQSSIYGPLMEVNQQLAQETGGEYKPDELYQFSTALEGVLAGQDTPTQKLAKLYAMSGE